MKISFKVFLNGGALLRLFAVGPVFFRFERDSHAVFDVDRSRVLLLRDIIVNVIIHDLRPFHYIFLNNILSPILKEFKCFDDFREKNVEMSPPSRAKAQFDGCPVTIRTKSRSPRRAVGVYFNNFIKKGCIIIKTVLY